MDFIDGVIAACELFVPENAQENALSIRMSVVILRGHTRLTIGQLLKLFPVLI